MYVMGSTAIINIVLFHCVDRYCRQILTSKVGPRTERVKLNEPVEWRLYCRLHGVYVCLSVCLSPALLLHFYKHLNK